MANPEAPRRLLRALLAIVIAIAAVPAYLWLIDRESMRSSGAPMFVLLAIAALVAATCFADRRIGVRALALVPFAIGAFFAWGFFFATRLPEPKSALALGDVAPDFRLHDQSGGEVALSALEQRGPTMLVFFRGAW